MFSPVQGYGVQPPKEFNKEFKAEEFVKQTAEKCTKHGNLDIVAFVNAIQKNPEMRSQENLALVLPTIQAFLKAPEQMDNPRKTFTQLVEKSPLAGLYVLKALNSSEDEQLVHYFKQPLAQGLFGTRTSRPDPKVIRAFQACEALALEYGQDELAVTRDDTLLRHITRSMLNLALDAERNPLKENKVKPLNAFLNRTTGFVQTREKLLALQEQHKEAKAACEKDGSEDNKKRLSDVSGRLNVALKEYKAYLSTAKSCLAHQVNKSLKAETTELRELANRKINRHMLAREHNLANTERLAHNIGMVPVLGSLVAGTLEAVIGIAQIVFNVVALVFDAIALLAAKIKGDKGAEAIAKAFAARHFNHIKHGLANIANAAIDFTLVGFIYRIVLHFINPMRYGYVTEDRVRGEHRLDNPSTTGKLVEDDLYIRTYGFTQRERMEIAREKVPSVHVTNHNHIAAQEDEEEEDVRARPDQARVAPPGEFDAEI